MKFTPFPITEKSVRNVFKPRWWQFRFHYRMWKQERRLLRLVTQKTIDDVNAAIEHEFVYGKKRGA